jgi:hypothetical protein
MVGIQGADQTGRRQTARSELSTMNPSYHLPLAGDSILSYVSRYRRLMRRLRAARRSAAVAGAAVAALAASFASMGSSRAHAASVSAGLTETRGLLRVDGAGIAYREFNPTARGTALLLIVGYG